MSWKPTQQERAEILKIIEVCYMFMGQSNGERPDFTQALRQAANRIDAMPAQIYPPFGCDCVSLSGKMHATDCKNPVGPTRKP